MSKMRLVFKCIVYFCCFALISCAGKADSLTDCLSLEEIQALPAMSTRQRDVLLESKGMHLYDDSSGGSAESMGWRDSANTTHIRIVDKLGIEYQFNAQCYNSLYLQLEATSDKKPCDASSPGLIAYSWISKDGTKNFTLMKGANDKKTMYALMVVKQPEGDFNCN